MPRPKPKFRKGQVVVAFYRNRCEGYFLIVDSLDARRGYPRQFYSLSEVRGGKKPGSIDRSENCLRPQTAREAGLRKGKEK